MITLRQMAELMDRCPELVAMYEAVNDTPPETARCIWCGNEFKRSDPRLTLCPVCLKGEAR